MRFSRCCGAAGFCLLALVMLFPLLPARAAAQQREHLTPQEVERVRDAQALDRRMDVFIRAAQRRMAALVNPQAPAAPSRRDLEQWGELPASTRAQLLSDLVKIFEEAITNIDDVGARTPQSNLLPRAVRKLADAANAMLPQLLPLRDSVPEQSERAALEHLLESLQEIIEASRRAPSPQ